jgi:hypothetical protein
MYSLQYTNSYITSINLIGRYPNPIISDLVPPGPLYSGNDVIRQRAITARVVPGSRSTLTPLEPNIADLEGACF